MRASETRPPGLHDADPSTPDGQLRGALRHFQALRGLEVTGTLDEPTITGLREAHGC